MGHTQDLLEGLAQLAVAAGLALYNLDGYARTDTGIGIGELPESCDRAIGITDYLVADDSPDQAVGAIRVQLWFRGLPDDRESMTNMADAWFYLLQGLEHRQFGTCHANQIYRISAIGHHKDTNNRFERSDNYHVDTDIPVTANRPF